MYSSTRTLRRNTEPAIPESVPSRSPTPPCPELSQEHRSRMNSQFHALDHNHRENEQSGRKTGNYLPLMKTNVSVDHLPEAIPSTPNSAFSATFPIADMERRNSHLRHSALKIFSRYKKKKPNDIDTSLHSPSIFSSMRPRSAARLSLAVNPVEKHRYGSNPTSERRTSILHSKLDSGPMTATLPIQKSMEFSLMRNSILPGESSQTALSPNPASSTLKKTDVISSPHFSSMPTPPILLQPPPSRRRESTPSPKIPPKVNHGNPLHYLPTTSPSQTKHQTANSTDSFQSGSSSSSSFIGRSSKVTTPSSIETSEICVQSGLDQDNFPPRSSSKPSSDSLIDMVEKTCALESRNHLRYRPPTPPSRNSESKNTPTVFGTGTAKVARSISGSGVERACIVRCSTPNATSLISPTRLATSACGSRPDSSMSMNARIEEIQSNQSESDDIREAVLMSPVRAERVDTRFTKQKSSLKGRRSSVIGPRSNTPPSPNLALIPDMSPRTPLPSKSSTKSQTMSLSCVMIVASTAPDNEQSGIKVPNRRNYCHQPITTPETEMTTNMRSIGNRDLEYNYTNERIDEINRNQGNSTNSPDCNSQVIWKTLEEEEERQSNLPSNQNMELRVRRMEQDNAILLTTLNTIVKKLEDMRSAGHDVVVNELQSMKSPSPIEKKSSWVMEGSVQNSPGRFKESDVIFNKVNY